MIDLEDTIDLDEAVITEHALEVGIHPRQAVEMLLNMGFAVTANSPNIDRLTSLISVFTDQAGVWSTDELAIHLHDEGVVAPERNVNA